MNERFIVGEKSILDSVLLNENLFEVFKDEELKRLEIKSKEQDIENA